MDIIQRLNKPAGVCDVVIDTDTFNEVDDQFALAYLIRSSDKLNLKGIFAAPFLNEKVSTPEEGMLKSYDEIINILNLSERSDLKNIVYKGSINYLPDENFAVPSSAASRLIELAKSQPVDKPLYVIAIGAITNIASALISDPSIKNKIVVVWLGGQSYFWQDTREFNMFQDIAAARVVFGCGVPLVQLPCMGVVSHLATTGPELAYYLKNKNPLCDYLYNIVVHDEEVVRGKTHWSRIIWDVSAVAWLIDESFTIDTIIHSPIPTYDGLYSFSDTRHFIKTVTYVYRDLIFKDLFTKLVK